ncbi:MAG: hypothetical protein LUH14_11815 [Clostridiaceae bacterium]|nr:hypothetical protein [Clostridiaceae bacterium]
MANYQNSFQTSNVIQKTSSYDDEEARQYICKKCGSVIVTDNRSAITHCPFCNGQSSLGGRIAGEPSPTALIPFTISQKNALKAYRKWKLRLILSPKELAKQQKNKKLIPVYLPFWLYDLECHGEARLSAETAAAPKPDETAKAAAAPKPDKNTAAEIKHFALYRQGQIALPALPLYSGKSIDKKLIAHLPPYDMRQKREFELGSLAGRLSEKCAYSAQELHPQAEKAAKTAMDDYLKTDLSEYTSAAIEERDYQVTAVQTEYLLCPVWLAFCDSQDPDYMFLLNAQNGEPALLPPVSKAKAGVVVFLIAVFVFLILRLITVLMGGPLI